MSKFIRTLTNLYKDSSKICIRILMRLYKISCKGLHKISYKGLYKNPHRFHKNSYKNAITILITFYKNPCKSKGILITFL